MADFTERRYTCSKCRQQVLVRFETQQAIVANPKACTRECAFGKMIVGAKHVIDQDRREIAKVHARATRDAVSRRTECQKAIQKTSECQGSH
ncbi:MAG: hypothetical protein AAFS12_07660 [Cyanobacteria bacterium J06632_19]